MEGNLKEVLGHLERFSELPTIKHPNIVDGGISLAGVQITAKFLSKVLPVVTDATIILAMTDGGKEADFTLETMNTMMNFLEGGLCFAAEQEGVNDKDCG